MFFFCRFAGFLKKIRSQASFTKFNFEKSKRGYMKKTILISLAFSVIFAASCAKEGANTDLTTNTNPSNSGSTVTTGTPATTKADDGFVASEAGTEKAKPESGKANVQGKVMFNGKPVEGIEVKICEKFSKFAGGCSGENFTSKTDANGEYLISNIAPKIYESILVRVFNTKSYIFATKGLGISAAKYKIEADKTFFAPETNLFKDDLKVQNLKPNSKIDAVNFELKWDAYPDAAYYKLSFFAKEPSVTSPYINEKVEGANFKLEKPMPAGEYFFRMEAFNADDVKISELSDQIKLTVNGAANAAPENK